MNTIAYIDGDIVKYRCAFAAEKIWYLVQYQGCEITGIFDSAKEAKEHQKNAKGTIWTRKEVQPLEFALQATKTTMEALISRFNGEYVVYLSGPTNFRDMVAVTRPYKGNRDRARDPVYKDEVEEFLIREYGAVRTSGIEADDAIGIAMCADSDGCIVSTDKDLDQIPGRHYNWVSGESYVVNKRQADYSLWTQVLSGDSTDNIPGLEGVGPVKAREILDGSKSSLDLAQRAWAAYRSRFDSREAAQRYFLEQLNLVYILRRNVGDNDAAILNLPIGFTFD